MRLSRLAVQRPVFTIMAFLIVIIFGGVAWTRLPIDLMPDITYPTLSISSEYENASPEEIEELVTRPLEEALTAVPGVEEITSVSAEGRSNVRVTFTWGTDLDAAANDVRDRLDRVMPRLPEDTDRPRLRKYDLASFPILILGASSDLDPLQMRKIIDDQVKYRIERVPGVAALDVRGGLDREIHVKLNPEKLKALGLPIDLILKRIREGNINLPAGTLERGSLNVRIRTPGIYISLEELANTVVAVREGVPVRLREVAKVEDSWEKITRIVRVNGRPGFRLVVNKQSGKNTVEVAEGVLREIERINRDIPQIRIIPIIDTSDYIQRSITNVGSSILYGGVLAIIVLFLFLRNIPSTAIIATAIPISIIAAFGLMYFGNFTLNLMTLGGLALGIGMLVDNAIVVLENIYRHRESGIEPRQAAVTGSEEVSAAVVASTLTTLAVFLPMIFVRGMSGVMFKQLSFVVGFSLTCSLAVALTLVPMLASRILAIAPEADSASRGNRKAGISRLGLHLKTGMEERYRRFLHLALDHRKTVIIGATLLMIGSLALIPVVGVEFMPGTDEGEVRVYGEMTVGTKLEVVDRAFRKIEAIVKKEVPEARNTVSFIGGTSWRARGSHTGQIRIALKPESERTRSSEKIAGDLRKKLSKIPGTTIRTRAGQGLFILRLGSPTGEKVQVEIRGHDLDKADILAQSVKGIVEGIEGVTDAQVSRESGSPEELIIVDRQKAADMKLTVSQIANMLQTVLSGTGASNYREGGDEYRILVKLEEAEQKSLREILDMTLVNADGEAVVLRNVVRVSPRSGPVLIERKDQERIMTVSANISGRDMGSILGDIRKGLRTVPLPQDFSIVFGGDYEEQQKAFRELLLGFILALVLVYMVMASLYESLRDPFVVMFSVPLAAIGVILMLLITGTTFNVQSYIGCIMLGGIVVNNAILLVDHINQLRRRDGMPLREAIEEAGRRRLRPILMTAATTMLALVPLALGLGEGGEAQAPMARAVIGGLLSSTLITLIFVPVVYSLFERRSEKRRTAKSMAACLMCVCLWAFAAPGTAQAGEPGDKSDPTIKHDWAGVETGIYKPGASVPAMNPKGPIEVTVEDAIMMALENNHSLSLERVRPLIRRTFEHEERAIFDPVLNGSMNYYRDSSEERSKDLSSVINQRSSETEAAIGVSKFFATGTELGLDVSSNRTWTNQYSDRHENRAGLSVTQALLRGRDVKANLASIRQAELDTRASQYELRGFAEFLVAQVEETYWDYALEQMRIKIFEESLDVVEQYLRETEEMISVGKLAETELTAVQAERALRRQDLINAHSSLKTNRLHLLRLLNPPVPDPWNRDVRLLNRPVVPGVVLDDVKSHVDVALRMRPDVNEARLRIKRGDLEICRTKNGLLPKMDLFINLGKSGYADSFSRSIRNLNEDSYDVSAGVEFQYPFYNRNARALHQRAVLSRDQSLKAVENLLQLIETDVRAAFIEVHRARQQISASTATRELQEEQLQIEAEKFRVGRSTNFLVAQVQRDLVSSQISEVEAVVSYLKALVELHRLEGSLLARRGILAPGQEAVELEP